MKKRLAMTVVALMTVLMTTCGLLSLPDTGALLLKLSSNPLLTLKTIVPDLDMEAAYYDIYGTGPGGATFEQLEVTEDVTLQAALIPGEWTIEVEAYNSDEPPTLIGYGSGVVNILAGEVVDLVIVVEPIEGDGQLEVTVTWPADVLIEPEVAGSLEDAEGTSVAISFTTDEDETSAYYLSGDLANGYYILSVWLSTERADGTGRDTVWGTVEAVRIVADEVSSELFELEEDVNRGGVFIEAEFENPFDVSIIGVNEEELAGDDITAEALPDGADSYRWYLDGVPVPGGGISPVVNDIEIEGTIPIGHHWLSVVVTIGTVMSSASVEFDVVRDFSGTSLWGSMVWGYDDWE